MAYHLYPQLIPQFCNIDGFGPPRGISLASPWPWVDHLVSCLLRATRRPIQTRFRFGSGCDSLNLATQSNSPDHSPKGTPSGLPRERGIALRLFVSIRFQVLFHSANSRTFHLSLTVLVHYRSPRVFSLGRWASRIPTGLACPVVLRNTDGVRILSSTGLSPSLVGLSSAVRLETGLITPCLAAVGSYNPCTAEAVQVWAAPLSLATTRGMVSFPEGTEMFQFPSFPPDRLWIQRPVPRVEPGRVSPFGHPRINACTRLPEAYRSVPRPSSALGAKASTVRP